MRILNATVICLMQLASPRSQDLFAIAKMDQRGILDDVMAGNVKEALSSVSAGREWPRFLNPYRRRA